MLVNLAFIQERVAAAIPEREAIIWGDRTLTYADLAQRTRRLARAFRKLGLGCRVERAQLQPWESGQDHIALYLYNCPEFLEAMYGSYKARAVSVNINYRYKAEELHYLLTNSRARAVIYHGALAPTLAAVRDRLPDLEHFIQVADESGEPLLEGAFDYEALVGAESADPLDLPYSADDLYVLYTGGTTGMPKGVLWRQQDVFYNGLGGNIPGLSRIETEEQLCAHINLGIGGRALVCQPFMHGAGQWSAFNCFHRGGTVILPDENRRLDPHSVWRAVERFHADQIGIVGDAFARPLIAAQRERGYNLSSLRVVVSTAAVLSRLVKEELLAVLPQGVALIESIGGSELGMQAMSYDTESGQAGLPAYQLRPGTVLLKADRSGLLRPGSDETGWITSSGDLCLGYLDDPALTLQTFPVIAGVRYAVGGDRGRYLTDGRVLFLGREAACINTGGEKVYAEEVERIVKSQPSVYDTLVVGVANERWGQQVTAVISLATGCEAPTLEELRAYCARHLADYKIPKAVVVVPSIARSPSGKPDYEWAKRHATAVLASSMKENRSASQHSPTNDVF